MKDRVKVAIAKFSSDERGGVSVMMLVFFLMLILTSGWALDLMMHETERADLQDSLDRGVIAAAARTTTDADAKAMVEDFVARRTYADPNRPVTIEFNRAASTGFTDILVEASHDYPTIVAHVIYHDEYVVPAVTRVQVGATKIEISLVLDISASMAHSNTAGSTETRLAVLRSAATDFVYNILGDTPNPDVSISLIPYAYSVSPGDYFFEHLLAGAPDHEYSRCIEFLPEDYETTVLPPQKSRTQLPQFHYWGFRGSVEIDGTLYRGTAETEWGSCPQRERSIVPFSNDASVLAGEFAQWMGHDSTGTHTAMKWGVALLDPTTQPHIANLAGQGEVPALFANRPLAYEDPETQKIIVLMSDGGISLLPRPNASELSDPDRVEYWAEPDLVLNADGTPKYSRGNLVVTNALSSKANKQFLDNPGFENRSISKDYQRSRFSTLCNVAKEKGIRIFTIGFDIAHTNYGATDMEACATEGDYFNVEGPDLNSAFDQIENVVRALRLSTAD